MVDKQRRDQLLELLGCPSETEARAYFARHNGLPEMEPLGKACHDCAVVWGFYEPYSAMLSLLTPEEQQYHSARWFCHNNPNRACRGNIDWLANPPHGDST